MQTCFCIYFITRYFFIVYCCFPVFSRKPNCIVINTNVDQYTNYIYFHITQPVSSIIFPLVVSLLSFVSLSTQVCCDQGLPPTFCKARRCGYRGTNGTQVFLNLPSPFSHLSPDSCLLHSVTDNTVDARMLEHCLLQ